MSSESSSKRNVYKGPIASPFPNNLLDESEGDGVRKGRPCGQNLGDDMFPDLKVMDNVCPPGVETLLPPAPAAAAVEEEEEEEETKGPETTTTTTTTATKTTTTEEPNKAVASALEPTATLKSSSCGSSGWSSSSKSSTARFPAPAKIPSAAAIGAAAAEAFGHSRLSATVIPGVSNRNDFPLIPSKAALLVIDIQEYVSKPRGKSDDNNDNDYLYKVALPSAVANMEALVQTFRRFRDDDNNNNNNAASSSSSHRYGSEVIFTYLEALTNDCRDVSLDYKLSGPKLAHLPSPEHPAAFLSGPLQPSTSEGKGDIMIPKTSCSVFMSTNLDYVLKNLHVQQLVICGQLTHQCVESAVRDAADLGYFVTLVHDACAATSVKAHEKGVSGVQGLARIVSTQDVLREMAQAPPALPAELSAEAFAAPVSRSAPETTTTTTEEEEEPTRSTTVEPGILPTRNGNVIVLESHQQQPTAATTTTTLPLGIASAADSRLTSRSTLPNEMNHALTAMLHALQVAGVEFVRYAVLDLSNNLRCKVVPLQRLFGMSNASDFFSVMSIAQVCMGGLPTFADYPAPDTGLDANHVLSLRPDFQSLRILPYAPDTAMVLSSVHHQVSGQLSPLCSRGLLQRVLDAARHVYGISFSVGAELEFTLVAQEESTGVDGQVKLVDESVFATTGILNGTHKFLSDLQNQLVNRQRIAVELIHAESAYGQMEVVLEYQDNPMLLADAVVLARETIRECAKKHGMKALFLPKIFPLQAGNGLHLHFSMTDLRSSGGPNNKNALVGPQAGTLSALGGSFIEGLLRHLPALLSVSLPSQNSFRRVGPGCWTGHLLGWEVEDKESPIRVCLDLRTGHATHVEYKLSDAMANIYLELATILSAGLHGMAQGWTLRPPASSSKTEKLPQTLEESLACLQADELLCSVMGPEMARAYVAVRRSELKYFDGWTLEQEVAMAYRRA